ncbi:TlpA disulfide reductase family protein [Kordia sp.]|uniref:TlpA disulfide reductase family protein n=1 Tax=Kordia sp. TaxID=1965332 RepID=UPI0025C3A775|nr:TlpA disulfide reductase family protein [Kordia sp.]MCH2193098.1 AhpC/TSA family protein [Kordia sp.]
MKKVFVITCIIGTLLFSACDKKTQNSADGYTIETTINGLPDGVRAFLKVPNEKGVPQPKDTAVIQNGKFTFTGKLEHPELGFIYINGAEGNVNLLLENATITIDANKDNLSTSKVSGGKHNQEYVDFVEDSKALSEKVQKIRARYQKAVTTRDTAVINAAKKQVADLDKQAVEYQEKYVLDHPDSYISVMLVNRMLRSKLTTAKKAKQFFDALPDDMKKTRVAQDLFIKSTEMLRSTLGSVATNFSAPNPEGKKISLDEVKSKVTIIDFWASWCGPCRRENPNVVKIYEKYHKDGLEIIGVSLDGRPNQNNAREDWLRAIKTDGLQWPQVSNLDGFRDAIARTYNVRSIPATFILNEKGEIVEKNLRGASLEAKIKELLGK